MPSACLFACLPAWVVGVPASQSAGQAAAPSSATMGVAQREQTALSSAFPSPVVQTRLEEELRCATLQLEHANAELALWRTQQAQQPQQQ